MRNSWAKFGEPEQRLSEDQADQEWHLSRHVKVHEDDIKGIRPSSLQDGLIRFLTIKGPGHLHGSPSMRTHGGAGHFNCEDRLAEA